MKNHSGNRLEWHGQAGMQWWTVDGGRQPHTSLRSALRELWKSDHTASTPHRPVGRAGAR